MPPAASAARPHGDYRQHLEIETPELVMLDYEIAGIGSRALAAILDALILGAAMLALVVVFAAFGGGVLHSRWFPPLFLLLFFLLGNCYYIFFEGFRHGQTPGKRRIGIRVVRDTGHPAGLAAAALRSLLRVADFLPASYFVGGLLVALHPRAKRLGDLVAGTIVVRDRPTESPVSRTPRPASAAPLAAPELPEAHYRALHQFALRADALPPLARARLAAGFAERLAPHLAQLAGRLPAAGDDDVARLLALHVSETERRRGRLGGGGTARAVADQLAARKQERWDAFDRLAQRAANGGLDRFRADELPDFAARYREVAADLARLRTYRAEPGVLARVERLVAAGHNAFYRDNRRPWRRLGGFIFGECPAAVLDCARPIALAFFLFAAPAAVGVAVVRERPALAEDLLPPVMLQRAEEGHARLVAGRGYAETDAAERPLVAGSIIANNVRVAFLCFAGGIFAGVGSLFFLAYNGLQLGLAAGHFANAGLLGYLLEFIVGHGALELFAIWVAGAAGFLLGRALVAPGDDRRADALVAAGGTALRLVGAAVCCLIVAGTIEGFVSTSGAGLRLRSAVSAASVALLVLYLIGGARRRRAREGRAPATSIG